MREWEPTSIYDYMMGCRSASDKATANHLKEKNDFLVARFELFREKINKKRQQISKGDTPQIETTSKAIAHYFRIQGEYFALQEREGFARALELFSVSKRDLLREMARLNQQGDDCLALAHVLALIDRYYFLKLPWRAEIP